MVNYLPQENKIVGHPIRTSEFYKLCLRKFFQVIYPFWTGMSVTSFYLKASISNQRADLQKERLLFVTYQNFRELIIKGA